MKMVAAAKLRRAQDAVVNARPFAYRIYSILLGLVERDGVTHPLLEVREEKKIRVVILAGDRGLCGAYNANVYTAAAKFIKAKQAAGVAVTVDTIGRKAFDFAKKRYTLGENHEGLLTKSTYTRLLAARGPVAVVEQPWVPAPSPITTEPANEQTPQAA